MQLCTTRAHSCYARWLSLFRPDCLIVKKDKIQNLRPRYYCYREDYSNDSLLLLSWPPQIIFNQLLFSATIHYLLLFIAVYNTTAFLFVVLQHRQTITKYK